jgi:hypothetical protein
MLQELDSEPCTYRAGTVPGQAKTERTLRQASKSRAAQSRRKGQSKYVYLLLNDCFSAFLLNELLEIFYLVFQCILTMLHPLFYQDFG